MSKALQYNLDESKRIGWNASILGLSKIDEEFEKHKMLVGDKDTKKEIRCGHSNPNSLNTNSKSLRPKGSIM